MKPGFLHLSRPGSLHLNLSIHVQLQLLGLSLRGGMRYPRAATLWGRVCLAAAQWGRACLHGVPARRSCTLLARREVARTSPARRGAGGARAAPTRGPRAGDSKLTVPRALPRLRSSRREAPRRGGTCCPGAPAPPAVRRPGRAPAHFSLTFGSPAGNFVAA